MGYEIIQKFIDCRLSHFLIFTRQKGRNCSKMSSIPVLRSIEGKVASREEGEVCTGYVEHSEQ
jgi:hypothetical protein